MSAVEEIRNYIESLRDDNGYTIDGKAESLLFDALDIIEAVESFVEKNYKGGSKADRADYSQMVSCRDIWELRNSIK